MTKCIVLSLIGLVAFYCVAFGALAYSARTSPYRIDSASVAVHGVVIHPYRGD